MRGKTQSSWQRETSRMTDIKMGGNKEGQKEMDIVDSGKSIQREILTDGGEKRNVDWRRLLDAERIKDRRWHQVGKKRGVPGRTKIKTYEMRVMERNQKVQTVVHSWISLSQMCQNIKSPWLCPNPSLRHSLTWHPVLPFNPCHPQTNKHLMERVEKPRRENIASTSLHCASLLRTSRGPGNYCLCCETVYVNTAY